MSYALLIKPEAEADLVDCYEWYEGERRGLGLVFTTAVEATLRDIRENPRAFQELYRSTRRASIDRFPYGVFFHIDGETVVVTSIVHSKRHPRQWRKRAGG